jgi:hypothetical protein
MRWPCFHRWRFSRCLADQRPPVVLVKCEKCGRLKTTRNLGAALLPRPRAET